MVWKSALREFAVRLLNKLGGENNTNIECSSFVESLEHKEILSHKILYFCGDYYFKYSISSSCINISVFIHVAFIKRRLHMGWGFFKNSFGHRFCYSLLIRFCLTLMYYFQMVSNTGGSQNSQKIYGLLLALRGLLGSH